MEKGKKKILIVEDEDALLDLYALKFAELGFDVLKAGNGDEGIALAKTEVPDLILLDIIMPYTDGYTMIRALKEELRTRDISIIIFSNLSAQEEIEKGLKLGAKDFIIKTSVTPQQLADRVEAHFSA